MECIQPAAWTMNRCLHVTSHVKAFPEDRPIPAQTYLELRTLKSMSLGVITVLTSHPESAPASPDMRLILPDLVPHAYQPPLPSLSTSNSP